MNKKQVRVMWIGIALFLLAILLKFSIHFYFTPIIVTVPKWFILFFVAPISQVIAAITIGLVVTFRDKKNDKPTDDQNNKQANR